MDCTDITPFIILNSLYLINYYKLFVSVCIFDNFSTQVLSKLHNNKQQKPFLTLKAGFTLEGNRNPKWKAPLLLWNCKVKFANVRLSYTFHILRTPGNHAFRTKEQGGKRKTQNKYNNLTMVSIDCTWKQEMHKYLLHILTANCETSLPLLTSVDYKRRNDLKSTELPSTLQMHETVIWHLGILTKDLAADGDKV
jgi:hypothetical protein